MSTSYRPQPFAPPTLPTVYLDYTTGKGVDWDGRPFAAPISSRRKNPTLADKLDAVAAAVGPVAEKAKIIFTGKIPATERGQRHWLLVQTPGWVAPRGHWLGTPPTGRFTHELTGVYIEVRTAAEWFGDTPLRPAQARDAFMVLDALLGFTFGPALHARGKDTWGKTLVMHTPASTGTNLWAAAMPRFLNPTPADDDIAEELHATSTQHHLDHLVAGPAMAGHEDVVPLIDRPEIEGFSYVDGRFMYGSLCRELGMGPGVRKRAYETMEILENNPYVRARIRVRFTVPKQWHHVGIFGLPHANPADGWYYPNRPGATGETWADAAEVMVARKHGWSVEPLESIVFNEKMPKARTRTDATGATGRGMTKARPLDDWATKLGSMRESITHDPELPPLLKRAVGAALRAILIQSIGSFASRGRGATAVVDDPKLIPPDYVASVRRQGTRFIYTIPQSFSAKQALYYHPEYAVQVWGRGRAKVLDSRGGTFKATGALSLPGHSIIGINGDAIYSTEVPTWALPIEQGGADDGKTGRLRLQGHLTGGQPAPATRAERDKLKERAVSNGTEVEPEDQTSFAFEWHTPADDAANYQASEEQ